ncbi:hypothetical protein THAOC_13713 [Thalassiosira oceanica]|uniref:Uncharacterized protein n=1 Tax=Thalassiosira oceanica TaxID=159749 RepID=K0SKB0_THAOC|nr:hypothetical protein THAOC_13713 [Thalassiosira oceanica]|eukprot:EJK65424.1 hypothetical protein THAOC_13713 [Thalassiosira oceanica]
MGDTCAFCRTPTPDGDAAILALVQKRVDAGDPVATQMLGYAYCNGDYDVQQDIPRAIELWTEAARLSDLDAHYYLGHRYYDGDGVEQDVARGVKHWQYAAMQGHPDSRFELGCIEYDSGNHELAVRHWMVSAKMGQQGSLMNQGHENAKGLGEASKPLKSNRRSRKFKISPDVDLSAFKGSSDGPSEASQAFEVGQDARPPALLQYIPGGVGAIAQEDLGRFIRELETEVARMASSAEKEARATPPAELSPSTDVCGIALTLVLIPHMAHSGGGGLNDTISGTQWRPADLSSSVLVLKSSPQPNTDDVDHRESSFPGGPVLASARFPFPGLSATQDLGDLILLGGLIDLPFAWIRRSQESGELAVSFLSLQQRTAIPSQQ